MGAIVQKYGGTSVADAERIRAVARRVAETRRAGHDVVVIVSAMGHTTDQFMRLSREVSPNEHPREMDMLLTAGERISMALLAMAIRDLGLEAVSLTGSQAGIITDTVHGRAEIQEVRAFRVKEHLERGHVVIVAGFQGVSAADKEITTLGRGGSDVTAVAMAGFLNAACEMYKDVDGIFTADPRVVPGARKLAEVSFEEMAELAAAGAQVLMSRSIEFGRRLGVPLHVRSSFHDAQGTWVRDVTADGGAVTAVAHSPAQVLVTVAGLADPAGAAAGFTAACAEARLDADIPPGPVASVHGPAVGVIVSADQVTSVLRVLAAPEPARVEVGPPQGKVSVIGRGMRADQRWPERVAGLLTAAGFVPSATLARSIRVSCLVPEADLEDAVRLLHRAVIEEPA